MWLTNLCQKSTNFKEFKIILLRHDPFLVAIPVSVTIQEKLIGREADKLEEASKGILGKM